ncbi:RNA polymerase sigma-70 factor [Danxiaibacter flavus]|uniref:RNA polymerase sigma-70 factor n=1 Tax=Danxiaibacter flavus TaxID=3049108 RepID=A0ABV3ZLC9_9BACT|nr:RNA polymerase sigma-70 factor [Chitinophagaceae bacterium DXS]
MYHLQTDERLLELLSDHDDRAFTEIYERYWEQLSLYVLKVTQSSEEASDIVQEIFVSLWKRRNELQINGPLSAYLIKAARNLSIRYIEKNIRKRNFLSTLSSHFVQEDSSTESKVTSHELESVVIKAVDKLPPKMRTVFLLSRGENLSHKEIAKRLGIAERTVKKQVGNALKVIRTQMHIVLIMAIPVFHFLSGVF